MSEYACVFNDERIECGIGRDANVKVAISVVLVLQGSIEILSRNLVKF